jgi:hypothetical protein
MESVTNTKALMFAVASAAGAGLYLHNMLLRMNDRSVGEGDSEGRLLWDLVVIGGLVLLTIYQLKSSCATLN